MRRKPLLVALFAIFVLSGWLSGVFLRETSPLVPEGSSSLITDNNIEPEKLRHQDYNTEKMLSLKITNPTDAQLALGGSTRHQPTPEHSKPESTESLEVPLTGALSDSQLIDRWRAIVLQTSAALLIGAAACILVSLANRYFTHLRS